MKIDIKPPAEILLEKKITPFCLFKGETSNPFLTPRGVSFSNNLLAVSDTGKNRVLIWNNFSFEQQQQADIILGGDEGNNRSTIDATTLQYPSGIWTNGEILIVADAWNHRVLIWHNMPTRHTQAADTVIGQPDFNSNQPNVEGLSKDCSAQSLYWPYGVCSNGKELWLPTPVTGGYYIFKIFLQLILHRQIM
jgi:hypothetical protein